MLGVMVALLYLYLSAGISAFSTWHEARRNSAQVATLEAQHRRLEAQHKALTGPSMVVAEARRLGMKKPGEQVYVVQGLPSD